MVTSLVNPPPSSVTVALRASSTLFALTVTTRVALPLPCAGCTSTQSAEEAAVQSVLDSTDMTTSFPSAAISSDS